MLSEKALKEKLSKRQQVAIYWLHLTKIFAARNDNKSQQALDAIVKIGGFASERDILLELETGIDVLQQEAKTTDDFQAIDAIKSLVKGLLEDAA